MKEAKFLNLTFNITFTINCDINESLDHEKYSIQKFLSTY